ncbi:DUF6963 family protein [Thalassobaculum fulvum]|uniref:DUF6963 family protein n=1 Tax=Thalassobaculum fulvum TaxID=1633335 RepID=UPI0016767DEC|nr:hypothetical protein [Thalassobaculum fulvum]
MTIGIAARGSNAGAAVLAGLAAVEAVGSGEIRGFGVFRALGPDGTLIDAETQDGGHAELLASLDRRGLRAPAEAATVAALISSGPNRPEPLTQFLAAGPAGLVTGHRRPDRPGKDGVAVNLAVLKRMAVGETPESAVAAVLAANPELDAGLIAVTAGALGMAETDRVRRRCDRGAARLSLQGGAAEVAVLHNAIQPFEGLAGLAAGAARRVLEAAPPPLPAVRLAPGPTVELGGEDGLWLAADGTVERIASANPSLAGFAGWTSGAVYLGTPVYRDGTRIGVTVTEAYCRLDDGRILEVAPTAAEVSWRVD